MFNERSSHTEEIVTSHTKPYMTAMKFYENVFFNGVRHFRYFDFTDLL